jgi:hypothetical protein
MIKFLDLLIEDQKAPNSFTLTNEQIDLFKKMGAFLSTGGNELYIPDLVWIDLNRNVRGVANKFKNAFYRTFDFGEETLASTIMTAIKKSVQKTNQTVNIKGKKYHVLFGHRSKNDVFTFMNPYRKDTQEENFSFLDLLKEVKSERTKSGRKVPGKYLTKNKKDMKDEIERVKKLKANDPSAYGKWKADYADKSKKKAYKTKKSKATVAYEKMFKNKEK